MVSTTTPTETVDAARPADLADRAWRILRAIIRFKMANDGCAPTIRWLQGECNVSSTSMVAYHLDRLEEVGLIERDAGLPRVIRVKGGHWRLGKNE